MLRSFDGWESEHFSFGAANASATQTSDTGPTAIAIDNGSDGPSATIPDSHLLFTAQFSRAGADLVLTGDDGKAFVVHDYFSSDVRARLLSAEGAALSPDVVAALAGPLTPGQYAQAGAAQPAAQAVGRVVQASGDATIVRNGVAVAAQAGDAILKGDVLQTVTGTFGVTFNDGSTLNLTANSRLVVNEFVYDPKGSANSQLLDLVQGSLTFISGEIAHNGDMKIGTPVATMAIRGTVGGVTNANDGTVNFYVSQSATGAVVLDSRGTIIANVVQDGPLIIVRPVGPLQVIAEEVQKSPAQLATELSALQQIVSIQAVGQQIIQQFFQPDPNATPNPNPQSTDKPHAQIQIELQTNPTPLNDPSHNGDNNAPPHQITATVTVITPPTAPATSIASDTGHLTVTPSHAPVFDLSQYNFTSKENAPPGAVVGTVHATDADNDTLSYSITSGNSDHVFSIDSAGNIIVTGILDYESASSRDLVIAASDPASHSASTAIHIAIQDVSELTSASLTSSAGVAISGTQFGATTGFVLPGAGNVTTPGTQEDSITLGYTFNGTTSVVVADPMLHRTDFTSIGTASYAVGATSYFTSILSAGHGVTLSQTIALVSDASYFKTTIDIYNGSGSEISNVRFMRNIDPDQDVDAHGVYNTLNDVIQNPSGISSIAAVVATGPVTGVQVMFVGDDGGTWRGSAFGFTNINPYDSYAFSNPQDPDGRSADIGMSLTNQIGTLAAGGHAEISFITTANVPTSGADALVGTSGADTLNGQGGNDVLFGLTGADTFVFNAGFGKDTIADFAHGIDLLQFDSNVFASAQDVIDHHVTYANGNAVITYDAANTVTLDHVTLLSPSDIVIHNIMTS